MELKEAIQIMKTESKCLSCGGNCLKCELFRDTSEVLEAYAVVIEAAEKQISKTPDYEGKCYYDGELTYDKWICPNCGEEYNLEDDYHNYCPECGQRIAHEVPRTDQRCD